MKVTQNSDTMSAAAGTDQIHFGICQPFAVFFVHVFERENHDPTVPLKTHWNKNNLNTYSIKSI